jgi:hypothetical protein
MAMRMRLWEPTWQAHPRGRRLPRDLVQLCRRTGIAQSLIFGGLVPHPLYHPSQKLSLTEIEKALSSV